MQRLGTGLPALDDEAGRKETGHSIGAITYQNYPLSYN
jgi:hypothetical protein